MKKNYFFLLVMLVISLTFNNLSASVVDLSHLISNNNFQGDPLAWTSLKGGYTTYQQQDGCFEARNSDNSSSWFNLYQDIMVPAGVYRLSVNAFHRGYHPDFSNVVLYGTTTQKEFATAVKTIWADTTAYGSTPGTITSAKTAFDAGYWANNLNYIIVEDEAQGMGTLRVGIRNAAQLFRATTVSTGDIWTIWSNFKLYQISGIELNILRNETIANANSLLAEPTDYNDGGVLATTIATLTGINSVDLTLSSIKTLEAAMLTYKTNRMTAATSSKPADATHLINNASFESGHVSKLGTANGHYNEPKGWTLTYNTASTHTNNNITIIDNQVIAAGSGGNAIIPTQGKRSLVGRFRWTSGQSFTISQTVSNLMAGKYRISADIGKLTSAGTAQFNVLVAGSAVLNHTAPFKAGPAFSTVSAVFDALTGDQLVVSATMLQSGANEASIILDNIKLEYLGVESFITISPTIVEFTPNIRQKTINIKAGYIANDLVLTPSAGFTLSSVSIPASEATKPAGVDITITCTANTVITDGNLTIKSGELEETIALKLAESPITVSHAGLLFDQSFSTPATFTVSGDLFSNININAPAGIELSQNSLSADEVFTGKAITVTWDGATSIDDSEIELNSGSTTATINIFASKDNIISNWDGDDASGEGSKLTDFGWTINNTAGDNLVATFNNYNASSGIRLVPMSSQTYTYRNASWLGHRLAYLRSWGADASNTYNLAVNLDANKTYVFRGVAAWHNNETNPALTFSMKTTKDVNATVLATQTNDFTVRRVGADYKFEFTPTVDGIHYLNFKSSQPNDALVGLMYLAIYPKPIETSNDKLLKPEIAVYPTVTNGAVQVNTIVNSTIRVVDLSGRMVAGKIASGSIETIELPSTGVFIVEVNNGREIIKVKVFKVR